jgi:putative membrane protein
MAEFLGHLVVSAALLLVVESAVKGIHIDGAVPALLAALVLGLVNAFVKPLAVVLTLPLTVITFGLFYFVVSALMLKLSSAFVPGFSIDGFMPAVWGAMLLAFLNLLVRSVVGPGF